jgi:hypothetical protein
MLNQVCSGTQCQGWLAYLPFRPPFRPPARLPACQPAHPPACLPSCLLVRLACPPTSYLPASLPAGGAHAM